MNELEYILNYLEAKHNTDMQQVATDLDYSYDYIRGEKVKKAPSKKLIDFIKIKYEDKLLTLRPYKDSPYINETDAEHMMNEDAKTYESRQGYLEAHLRDAQQRAQIAEAEKDRLLTIIENLTKNQQGSTGTNDANGN